MTETFFLSIMVTGFVVAFAHAAIPTHWLPFVLAGRGQRWSKAKTLMVVALCGSGHVLFTTLLGALVVWLGIETSKWTGNVFPWIAGSALILFGLYYIVRQMRGGGHGHHHFGGSHSHGTHDHGSHDHGGHDHASETKRIDTGHGVLLLEVFEDGVPPRFRVRSAVASALPRAAALTIETLRPGGARQIFSFADRDGFLESLEEIPEPHEFTARIGLSHGDHAHHHEVFFEEHQHTAAPRPTAIGGKAAIIKTDGAVIASLFTLLTFSPCEGFLPVYLSGISYGWMGFVLLSAVLAVATVAGMVVFTWLTMSGMERLRLEFLERYESGILGALILFLGVGIIFFGF
ncbi:hypothetical protein [Aminobacter sp. Piv2-1]|uniref:hypothetical protein n=1 Tax=Aminobacter sp. Piv2-1 TaxID=3031122 RepID=UPI0030A38EA2